MDCVETEAVGMQLKYCECCGALWFRRTGEQEIYCPACAPAMAEVPQPGQRTKVRLPNNMRVERRADRVLVGRVSFDLEGSTL